MRMFTREGRAAEATAETTKTETAQTAKPAEQPISMSVLSPNLRMSGATIDSQEDLTVHGHFEGKLRCRHLIVSEGASVSGEIVAQAARVSGSISGNIRVDNLLMFKGSSVSGEVKCRSMGVQPGSTVKANIDCDMSSTINVTETQPKAAPLAPMSASAMTDQGDFGTDNIVRLSARG